jgi:hypothetical protein
MGQVSQSSDAFPTLAQGQKPQPGEAGYRLAGQILGLGNHGFVARAIAD